MRVWARLGLMALVACAAVKAAAKTHVDDATGVSFTSPWPDTKLRDTATLTKMNEQPGVKQLGLVYTSGIASASAQVPYVLVWKMPYKEQITRAYLKQLGDGSQDLVFKLVGLRNWTFDRRTLLGTGDAPPVGPIKSRVAMVIAKGHYAYVGYFYTKGSQLGPWSTLVSSIKVAATYRLDPKTLPKGSSGGSVLGAAIKGGVIGGILSGLALAMWWFAIGRHRKKAGAGASTAAGAETAATPEGLVDGRLVAEEPVQSGETNPNVAA